jgi:hypothetical protein
VHILADFDAETLAITLVVIIPVAALIVLAVIWDHRRSQYLLRQWAERNDYRLVNVERRNFFRGPFFWNTSKGQVVYRVTVEDPVGNERSGYLRLGSWVWGLFSDEVTERWDEP